VNDKITEVPKFKEYLTKIGITKPLCQRIDAIFELAGIMYGAKVGDISDILVTDYIQADGSRVYAGVDFYFKDCVISSIDLTGDLNFGIAKIRQNVVFIRVKAKDYDFKKATEKSRLYVTCTYTSPNLSEFKAAKENCDYLKEIIRKYVVPNLIALASP
jgi:hypothetical protein